METNHINNVVLYAKNFYERSGDVIKDMQLYCMMDGAPADTVATPYDLLDVMNANYFRWIDSLPEDEYNLKHLREDHDNYFDRDETDPLKRRLWDILSSYRVYVPMSINYLRPPVYDEKHRPQYNIAECLFSAEESDDELMRHAETFLKKTQVQWMDENVRLFIDGYEWKECSNVISIIKGHAIYPVELKQEICDIYEEYKGFEYVHEDGRIDPRRGTMYTPHFIVSFESFNDEANIELAASLASFHAKSDIEDVDSALRDVFRKLTQSSMPAKVVNAYNAIAYVDEDADIKHLETVNGIVSSFESERDSMISDTSGYFHMEDRFYACLESGCFRYLAKRDPGDKSLTLDVDFLWFEDCQCKPWELESLTSMKYNDARY